MDKSLHVILMFLLTHLGLIFFMFPGNIVSSTEQGHWFPILFGFVLTFILISLYMKGLSYFPKQDIITIYSDIGKAATVFFSAADHCLFIDDHRCHGACILGNYYDRLFN